MNENAEPEDEMRAVEELLPWYAAGTLDAASVRRVEAALAREPKLQASLTLAREDRDETLTLNESLGAPGAQAWARVMAATQAEPRKPSPKLRFAMAIVRASAWLVDAPGRLALVTAACLVILLQAAAIVALLPKAAGPAYETASQQPALAEGATVLVAFAPDASLRQVAELLQKHKATIVDGPRSGGLFRLRIGDKAMTEDEFDAAVAALRAEPVVTMALPSSGR